jgi:hypothetical protein
MVITIMEVIIMGDMVIQINRMVIIPKNKSNSQDK